MSQAKKKSPNAIIVLTIIAVVAAIALAVVYNVTKGTIAANEAAKLAKAYGEVMPAESYDPVELSSEYKDAAVYAAKSADGETKGYCVTTKAKGYSGGEVSVTLGVNTAGVVQGCIVDASTQTSGFGSKCGEESFTNNFVDLDLMGDGVFPAVSGATITSKAVLAATNTAADCVSVVIKGQPIEGDNIAFGDKAGAAVAETKTASAKGFMGDVSVTVGFAEDGTIATVEYDVSGETPTYGGRYATEEGDPFKQSLIGATLPVDVDGLSGATFTGNAIKTAINSMKTAEAAGIDWTAVDYKASNDVAEAGILDGNAVVIPCFDENGTVTVNVTIENGVVTGVDYVEAAPETAVEVAETKTASGKGFQSDVTVTVGFAADGSIATVEYDVSGETPGFGQRYATDEGKAFKASLIGKSLPVSVDGLSGATRTCEAIVSAINSMSADATAPEAEAETKPADLGPDAVQASAEGFEATVKVSVTFGANGEVTGLIIDDSAEHPGISSDAAQDSFTAQFIGKTGPFVVGETKEGYVTVEGVSGATWTCKGAVEAINKVMPKIESATEAPAAEAPAVEAPAATELTASAQGFYQPVTVKVTLNDDGSVATLVVDASTQTDGFGTKAEEEAFIAQFIGQKGPFVVGQNVQKIIAADGTTGCTMTTNAVCEAVNSLLPAPVEEVAATEAPAVVELTASADGFYKPVTVKVTLNADGSVATLVVDASTQTNDYGTKAEEEAFIAQFIGQKGPFVVGQNVQKIIAADGVTGCTMTTNAVCEAVNSLLK